MTNELILTKQMLRPHTRALGTEIRIKMSQRHPWDVFLLLPSIMTSSEELERLKKWDIKVGLNSY